MRPNHWKATLYFKRVSAAATLILTTLLLTIVFFSVPAFAQTYQVIHNFSDSTGGSWALVRAHDRARRSHVRNHLIRRR